MTSRRKPPLPAHARGGYSRRSAFFTKVAGSQAGRLASRSFDETYGEFSPDGRWVAYASNESGTSEIYVAPFPGPGGKRQVSTAGGRLPRWRRDGTELFYVDLDRTLVTAAVNGKGARFEVGMVKPLFERRIRLGYAVTADGLRFLISTDPEQAGSTPITVVTNWNAGLKP